MTDIDYTELPEISLFNVFTGPFDQLIETFRDPATPGKFLITEAQQKQMVVLAHIAESACLPALLDIRTLGKVISSCSDSVNPLDQNTVQCVGFLTVTLSEIAEAVAHITSEANSILKESKIITREVADATS